MTEKKGQEKILNFLLIGVIAFAGGLFGLAIIIVLLSALGLAR